MKTSVTMIVSKSLMLHCVCIAIWSSGAQQIVIIVFEYSVMTTNRIFEYYFWSLYVSGVIMKLLSCYIFT